MKGAVSVQKAHPGIETEAREQGYRVKRVKLKKAKLAPINSDKS